MSKKIIKVFYGVIIIHAVLNRNNVSSDLCFDSFKNLEANTVIHLLFCGK